ncbi:hypothetical protein A2U01_0067493, partial [Trifolium medium]|nr:hypothetical protein [Trifolium medium]
REKEAEGEGLRVGEVLVRVGAGKGREGEGVTKKKVPHKQSGEGVLKGEKGVVATVKYGEAIPVVQARIADAGFQNL